MTKGVIRRDKEPRVGTTLDRRLPGGEGERIGVVGVMNRNRRAGLVRKARSARAVEHHDFVFLLPHLNRCEGRGRGSDIEDSIDVLPVEPLPGGVRSKIWFVLVVSVNELDRLPSDLPTKIVDRHLRSSDAACPRDI